MPEPAEPRSSLRLLGPIRPRTWVLGALALVLVLVGLWVFVVQPLVPRQGPFGFTRSMWANVHHRPHFAPGTGALIIDNEIWAARAFDPRTAELLGWLEGTPSHPSWTALDPTGRPLVLLQRFTELHLLDGRTLETLHAFRLTGWIHSGSLSEDGTRVLAARGAPGGEDPHTAWLWDTATGEVVHILRGHEDHLVQAAFAPGGSMLLTSGRDRTVRLWDPETGGQIHLLDGLEDEPSRSGFSPDGQYVYTYTPGSNVYVWSAETGELLWRTETGPLAIPIFSPCGSRVITRAGGFEVTLRNAGDGEPVRTFEPTRGEFYTGNFFSGDRTLFTPGGSAFLAEKPGAIALCDTETGEVLHRFPMTEDHFQTAVFTPDGSGVLLSSPRDGAVLYDLETGEPVRRFLPEEEIPPRPGGERQRIVLIAAAFSPEGERLAISGPDAILRLFDVESGEVLRTHPLRPGLWDLFRYTFIKPEWDF